MPKFKLAHLALVLVAAHDLRTQIRTYKVAVLFRTAAELYEETERANEAKIKYLCDMLDKNGVEVTEFDLIAMNELNNQ